MALACLPNARVLDVADHTPYPRFKLASITGIFVIAGGCDVSWCYFCFYSTNNGVLREFFGVVVVYVSFRPCSRSLGSL